MAKQVARLKAKPLDAALARFVRARMKQTGTPGVAVGILDKGRARAAGFGVTSLAAPAPVDATTLFQIGSTTKTFTATAIMRLVDKGTLDLDVPVRRYLRDLRLRDASTTRRVTLRHLLTHTGGWVGDYFVDTGRGDDALARMVRGMRAIPQLTPLGEVWHYNNAGFYIAGRMIERVTGKTYEDAIRELVLEPLGMTRTVFFADEAIMYRVAAGHLAQRGTRHAVAHPWHLQRGVGPAGTLISDVMDQLRWAQFHLGDGRAPNGKRLLKRSSMREMQRVQAPAGSSADHVGLAWLLQDLDGARVVAHGGTTFGQLSAFAMVPERDFAITVLTNSTRGAEVHREVVNRALRTYLGLSRPEPAPVAVNGKDLRAYEGRYVEGLKAMAVVLSARGRGFVVRYEMPKGMEDPRVGPFRMVMVGPDRAVVTDGRLKGNRVDFVRDARGRIRWVRLGGRLLRRSVAKL